MRQRMSIARGLLLAIVGMLAMLPAAAGAQWQASRIDVQILAINDFHGQVSTGRDVSGLPVGGMAYVAAYLDRLEADAFGKTIRVEVGDAVGASPPTSALLQDEPTIELMNEIGIDVGVMGNHEFDEGLDELLRLVEGGCHPNTIEQLGCFGGTDFPRLAANVVYTSTGQTILPAYEIMTVKSEKIAFIGVVTTDTPNIVIPSAVEKLTFLDEAETINTYVPELQAMGVEAIVVLSHAGGVQNAETGEITGEIADIANGVDDAVDIILSAHTHQGYVGTIDGKLVTQAFSYSTAIADIRFRIDRETGDIVSPSARIVTTFHEGIEPDQKIAEMVADYEELVGPIVNDVIGTAESDITREQSPSGESALGNLVADAQRWQTDADFAFMNPGGIRDEILAGEVTWGELYSVQPFSNDLVTMDLTGEQIYTLLNQQWQGDRVRFLQISGLEYTWNADLPIGERVVEVRTEDGTPIDRTATYRVVVNSFLAAGGDSFAVLREGTNREVGVVDLDALVDYIAQLDQPFSASIEGRITITDGTE